MSNEANRLLAERIFRDARFIRSLGVEFVDVGWGWCESQVDVTPDLRQQHGIVHAGVLMTLADHSCGGAAASTMPAGKDVVTVETKVSFLRPASGTRLTCDRRDYCTRMNRYRLNQNARTSPGALPGSR